MKAPPGARNWMAAGVRHELLMRVLPGLRHDMAAPVSLVRMNLLMLRRQVAAIPSDPWACEQRVALVDRQIGVLIDSVRALRDWELSSEGGGLTRTGLVQQCTGLMRAAFDLDGISLEADLTLNAPMGDEPTWPGGASLRYLLLGALCHLHDSAPDVGRVRVEPEGDAGLWVRAQARPDDLPRPDSMAPRHVPGRLVIDAASLQSLADDLGHAITIARDAVHLHLRGC